MSAFLYRSTILGSSHKKETNHTSVTIYSVPSQQVTLDRYAECRRFIVQDEEQLVGVCVDVHGVIYDDDDGSIALEVAYCKPAQAEMTPEVLEALKAAGPAEAPQMMAVTAKPAQLDELAAILVQGATALSEQDADRIKQST
eukprot:gene18077-9086_t